MATAGKPSAMTVVSHVWAFCAPPWMNTTWGVAVPHTNALTSRPSATTTRSRRTVGGTSKASPYSAAFS